MITSIVERFNGCGRFQSFRSATADRGPSSSSLRPVQSFSGRGDLKRPGRRLCSMGMHTIDRSGRPGPAHSVYKGFCDFVFGEYM